VLEDLASGRAPIGSADVIASWMLRRPARGRRMWSARNTCSIANRRFSAKLGEQLATATIRDVLGREPIPAWRSERHRRRGAVATDDRGVDRAAGYPPATARSARGELGGAVRLARRRATSAAAAVSDRKRLIVRGCGGGPRVAYADRRARRSDAPARAGRARGTTRRTSPRTRVLQQREQPIELDQLRCTRDTRNTSRMTGGSRRESSPIRVAEPVARRQADARATATRSAVELREQRGEPVVALAIRIVEGRDER
jgi:hypothetical protein